MSPCNGILLWELIFKLNGKSRLSILLLFCFLAGLFIFSFSPAVVAADYTLEVGEELQLELELSSRHEDWEVEAYDDSILELETQEKAVSPRRVKFMFLGLSEGTTEVSLVKRMTTRLVDREIDSRSYTVEVIAPLPDEPEPEPDEDPEPEEPEEVAEEYHINLDFSDYNISDRAMAVSDTVHRDWSNARNLRERGLYEAARELIEEKIENFNPNDENEDSLLIFWREKLALNYMADDEYESAIGVWENLIEDYPRRDVARWLYMIALAQRAEGLDDEAEITLLQIRHRHRGKAEWIPAMYELGDLMEEEAEYEEARSIWEQALRVASPRYQADLFQRLAELYSRQREVRDFPRAVDYYRQAVELLAEEEPDKADELRTKAQYLVENYIDYGVE